MVVTILLVSLAIIASLFTTVLLMQAYQRQQLKPNPEAVVLGAVTNFFDTLGIGSFAPTTAWLKLRALVPDSFIPATLTTGHALPTIAQAFIFIQLIQVDPLLLVVCIGCAVLGAIVGAPLVAKLSVRVVQGFVGVAMVVAAALYALANLNMLPIGGQALALTTPWLIVAAMTHFLLGALMTFGIGMYAPSLILLSLMGLNPTAAFPIMMGSCAFLMPVGGLRFARAERIDLRIVLGLAIGGIPAVLLAAYVVKSLPLTALRWGVVVVVIYAAILLLRSATSKAIKPK